MGRLSTLDRGLTAGATDFKGPRCILCNHSGTERIELPFPFFQHMGYRPMSDAMATIHRCLDCQTLFPDQAGKEQENRRMYRSREYATTRPRTPSNLIKENELPATPYFLVANIICSLLKKRRPRVLDIGCGEGKLLRELDERFDVPDLHGFDVSEYFGASFPKKKNFLYWNNGIEEIDGKFDLIVLMNSLVYIDNIHNVMNSISNKLCKSGIILVITPDASKNKHTIFLGDQFIYFTPVLLENFFHYFGYGLDVLDSAVDLPRHVVGVVRKTLAADDRPRYAKDWGIHDAQDYLIELKGKLEDLKERLPKSGRVAVLGTKLNAAVVHSILGDRIDLFVDENPNSEGLSFHGKPVRHPKALNRKDTVIIPFGQTSEPIGRRFKRAYWATVIQV